MMKNLLIATFMAAGVIASPVSVLVATTATAIECAPGAPAGYLRPGGYCDRIDSTDSIAPVGSGSPAALPPVEDECDKDAFLKLPLLKGERIKVAAAGPDCDLR